MFEINEATLTAQNVLKFDEPDEKWLDFVVKNRSGIEQYEEVNVVFGPVANDDVFGTILLYEGGQLTKDEAIGRFKVKNLFNQVVFKDVTALGELRYINSYEVEDAR